MAQDNTSSRGSIWKAVLYVIAIVGVPLNLVFWYTYGAMNNDWPVPNVMIKYASFDRPDPGFEVQGSPLGYAPDLLGVNETEYIHYQKDGTTPVSWDPCRPIHYVVSGAGPAGTENMIEEGFAEVSKATGLVFVNDGPALASVDYKNPWASYQKEVYGNRWAPVMLSWTDADVYPELKDATLGDAAPNKISSGGRDVYVSGRITFDSPDLAHLIAEGRTDFVRTTVIHEIAHIVGMGHSPDMHSLMYPYVSVADFSPADRVGLAALNSKTCSPQL